MGVTITPAVLDVTDLGGVALVEIGVSKLKIRNAQGYWPSCFGAAKLVLDLTQYDGRYPGPAGRTGFEMTVEHKRLHKIRATFEKGRVEVRLPNTVSPGDCCWIHPFTIRYLVEGYAGAPDHPPPPSPPPAAPPPYVP